MRGCAWDPGKLLMLHCPTCGQEYSDDLTTCPRDDSPLQADVTNISELPVDPLLGRTLDEKYLLEERLGIGGMGTVYRAKHMLIDRPVAVKVLNQRFVEDEAAKARFRREAKAAGRLQHANAVGVTDFGQTTDGFVYIVMELLEGRTLRDLLAKEGVLDVARAVSMMLQVSAAVAAAHEAGIIHRDLKPANIFIVQRSDVPAVVKVLDFGIAKLAADSVDEEDRQTLTQVGVVIGTPRYMSPEQCNASPLTPAADVYSLGVILYEMLTGMAPFSGSSPIAIAVRHTTEPPRRPSEFVASIPPAVEEVILHALEKNPQDRPADAEAFRRELFDTAERLGLEHAAASTAPSVEALRSAGTESPSGRLVVDLGRLRENRAATSSGELTVIKVDDARKVADALSFDRPEPALAPPSRHDHTRLNVALDVPGGRVYRKPIAVAAVLLAGFLITAGAFLVGRSRATPPATNTNLVASPSPAEPSPLPSPSVTPKKEGNRNSKPPNSNENNESKLGSVFKKGKRFVKKIF